MYRENSDYCLNVPGKLRLLFKCTGKTQIIVKTSNNLSNVPEKTQIIVKMYRENSDYCLNVSRKLKLLFKCTGKTHIFI